MGLTPDYGETLVSHEEAEALTPQARNLLGDPIRKADLFDLEQRIQVMVADEWWANLLNHDVPMRDLLNDHFARDLHRRLYAPVWEWGGRQRSRETNIGIAPEHIAVELRNALDDLSYQWEKQTGIEARELGIAVHAALVRIHPFVDGNGRATRLMADLAYLAGQTGLEPIHTYDWDVDRRAYVRLLGQYDLTRNPRALTEFIPIINLEDAS